jgi:2-methylisocitrate lyase-like PEP mutase family enzyme
LHRDGVLLLANVWDAGTARLIERAGAKAMATTSAGVAWAHGFADGNTLPIPLLLQTVRAIQRVIRVPLTVDCEAGYSDDPVVVAENIAAVIDAGAVGINLEDGNRSVDALCAKIEHVRRMAERRGIDLFINARTDAYLRGEVPAERRLAETLSGAARYRAAGASGIFVPGVTDAAEIRTLAAEAGLPLNVLARATLPPAAELAKLGVRRLSAGSCLAEAMYGRTAKLAGDFLRDGVSTPLTEGVMPYRDVNALIATP